MEPKKGNLSINSENIFPIIKKWLYSDHDIFYRELVSNACDAITKRKKLDIAGVASLPEDYKGKVDVKINTTNKTIKIIDNGIGMTENEVEEYITQIAFSGATKFLEAYKDKTGDDQIIGHFGLGFYSSFMVADEVHIDSLSFNEGATPVHWECDGGTTYTIEQGTRNEVGTTITLFLNEDSLEFVNEYKVREVLGKYCSFMPSEIYLEREDAPVDTKAETDENNDNKETTEKQPESLSDINPLWMKHPNKCEKDDYINFYHKVFNDYKEPLFWIHLNMDYPFNLKGILYFPRINTEFEAIEGTIKLYNNQVFIADNIKEVIPEYLMLLKGVIDCPDLPLNVSRSALQNDGFVKKISDYISKKVADKLSGMCKTDRENYEKYYDDIAPFVKYGMLKDSKFAEKVESAILFKKIDGTYATLEEYKGDWKPGEAPLNEDSKEIPHVEGEVVKDENDTTSNNEESQKEPEKFIIYYVTNETTQGQYVSMFKAEGKDAVILSHNIDSAFISYVERKNEDISFKRIDSVIDSDFKDEIDDKEKDEIKEMSEDLTKIVRKALNNDTLNVNLEKLKDENISSIITLSEETQRMIDMMKNYGMSNMDMSMYSKDASLVLNIKHPLVKFIIEHRKSKKASLVCHELYDLAMLKHRTLTPDEMSEFINRSNELMLMLIK